MWNNTAMTKTFLTRESRIWLKRRAGEDAILRVVPDSHATGTTPNYALFSAFEEQPDFMGAILFDSEGYWIYDGNELSVTEQEQVAEFILRGQ